MSEQPLDLQIFEKHPDVDAYRFGPSFTPYAIVAKDKRFTDAELAAEYLAAIGYIVERQGSARRSGKTHAMNVARTLHRFATLPHYDEQ